MSDFPDEFAQMRGFIEITDEMLCEYARATRPEIMMVTESVETPMEDNIEHPLLEEARDLVFKMRSFMEDASAGEYALGVESGMQRAADMVENLIRRYEKGDDLER